LHLHFCHISTEKALSAVAEAKKSRNNVTCEVTPHHLILTTAAYEHFGTMALTVPPLRTKENVDALWSGIVEGTVDTIGDDHAPHSVEEREMKNVWDVKAGIPGLETTLPLVLTMVHQNKLSLARAIELISEKPAEVFGLTGTGKLEAGKSADLVVVDFNRKYRINASAFKSKAKFSPFDAMDVQGKPLKTFVNGVLVMDDGDIVAKMGSGHLIRGKLE